MRKLLLTAAMCLMGLPVLVAQEENPFKAPVKVDSENPFAQPEKREGDGEREAEREGDSEREVERERDVPREGDRERETERDGEREGAREGERTISQEQLRELIGYLEKLRRENAELRQELARIRQRIDGVDRRRPDAPREGDRPRPDAEREGDRPRPDAEREGDRPRPDAEREGDRPRPDVEREGDRPRPDAPREGDRPRPGGEREGDRGQLAELEGVFKRYDKNSDKTVVLEEFLALHQGDLTEQARRFWQEFFVSQDRNKDGKWHFEEFVGAVRAYNQRQR
jgi:hypothetical protein